MNEFGKVVNAIYDYIDAEDPDKIKQRLDRVLDFNIRLRHSYVDNDKPCSACDVNMDILRQADLIGLRVKYVDIG